MAVTSPYSYTLHIQISPLLTANSHFLIKPLLFHLLWLAIRCTETTFSGWDLAKVSEINPAMDSVHSSEEVQR